MNEWKCDKCKKKIFAMTEKQLEAWKSEHNFYKHEVVE